ncbi:MAG: diaminopimelate decarboxylase [Deltaproteobacteria bacterium]|nr:diaminopimelate decarboxylase [Deltaproteobacteria bacterium]
MDHFAYHQGRLHCEGVSLDEIARACGTPCYVYSYATFERHFAVFQSALKQVAHLICYSVKANSNGAILRALGGWGAGADVVSGGELYRVLRAGIPAQRVVFSGVGKTAAEISEALEAQILMFNVESAAELELIAAVAKERGCQAPIALRVNPDVDPRTHPYIATGLKDSKFGIPLEAAWELYQRALAEPTLLVRGIDCHIGSQLTELQPVVDALAAVEQMARRLLARGAPLSYVDIGGGLGVPYEVGQTPPTPEAYGEAVTGALKELSALGLTIICEPGRVIAANAGVMLVRVLLVKDNGAKRFVVVDGAMNDLLRPSLYGSHHEIVAVDQRRQAPPAKVDVVGPICESGDFLAKDRLLPMPQTDDLLAVRTAGAYGFSMASNYNSRPRLAEVLVRGERFAVVRAREDYADLTRGESSPDWLTD